MHRNEHLRLTLFLDMLPAGVRDFVRACALIAIAALLLALVPPSVQYAKEEWFITSAALNIPNTFRVSALAFGIVSMLAIVLIYALRSTSKPHLFGALVLVGVLAAACWGLSPQLMQLGAFNIVIFLVGFVAVCLVAGVPIAFCFGIGAVSYLAFTTQVPLLVVVGRMDEGMSSLILVSVPIFVHLLGLTIR